MAISIFPQPVSNASTDGVAFTVPEEAKQYKLAYTFPAGIYSITTSPTNSQVFIEFNIANVITSTTTVDGSISVNLASECSEVYLSGVPSFTANTIVTIDKTGENISGTEISGTLDTLTTSGTYNTTGKLYVVAVGGGAGGAGSSNNFGGGGGGSGGVAGKLVYTNTSTSYTIGTAGNGGAIDTAGNAGNATNFGNLLTANGGSGGAVGNTGAGGAAGTPGGGAGGNGSLNGAGNNGGTSTKIGQTVKAGTTGGGGGGGQANAITNGGGSGIGTGGRSGIANQDANAQPASGYGSGGGGGRGGSANQSGGNGRPGVIYVLRDI